MVALFKCTSYMIYACDLMQLHEITLVKWLIDTRGGPNLVSESLLRPGWTSCTKRRNLSMLKEVNKQPVCSNKVILSHLQVGDSRQHVWFGVFDNSAQDLLLETSSIDKYIREIFWAKWKLVTLSLLTNRRIFSGHESLTRHESCGSHRWLTLIRICSWQHIPWRSGCKESYTGATRELTNSGERYRLGNESCRTNRSQLKLRASAWRIVNATRRKPFHIPLTNMATELPHILKSMIVAHVTDSSAQVNATEAVLLKNGLNTVVQVPHEPSLDRDAQMTRQKDVEL